jgi:glycosyltransferase involved in cell wall biosynthesis
VRIAVDGRVLRPGAVHQRGVARYLRCLLEALAAEAPEDDYAVVVAGSADPEPFRAPNLRLIRRRLPGRLLFGAAALAGRPRLDRLAGGCDVAWVPTPAPVAVSADVPVVLTLHDLSFEHPGDFPVYDRLWHRLARPRRLARRAARVLCVSTAVGDAAARSWGLDERRLRVVRSGPGRPRGPAGELPAGLPERFVLAVGALEPRKLPGVLAEAHRKARAGGLESGLVFAGDGPLRVELGRSRISRLSCLGGRMDPKGRTVEEEAIVLGHVEDPVLEALYGRALALACVSRDEGFGFTPVEAVARGVPAVVSDLPVFVETLGDGALRVPPGDADALAAALLRLEREPELRERLVASGREAVGHLSWERAARETRAVLAEAAA